MSLGGGNFTAQNKVLPGAYINFVSLSSASASLSDRGVATIGLELDWGIEDTVFEVTKEDLLKDSLKLFGYTYLDPKMKGIRDLFLNIKSLYAYRLNSGGVKATNTYATAKFCGTRGNDLKIVIQSNVDNDTLYDVKTILGTTEVDLQTVAAATNLVENDYVTFKTTASLQVTASTPLTTGTNGTVNGESHSSYLKKIESYAFNAIGLISDETDVKALYEAFTNRMRDEIGVKFQAVLYNKAANYEGIVNVKNKVLDVGAHASSLVYWVTGVVAGCGVHASNLNRLYNGEFNVDTDYTQTELITAIKKGEFTLHKVGSDVRVLEDINSLVTTTDTKGDIFKENQTIRVIDQIANDIAVLFNTKYLGVVPNDKAGRVSLWADIVKHHEQLRAIRAIEGFQEDDVIVAQGDTKKSVVVTDAVTVINAMSKLYMTVTVS